jgi:hypothetical protein
MNRSWLRPIAVTAMAAALAGSPGWAAAATATAGAAPAFPSCTGIIKITQLAFTPPAVSPGQLATANLVARNCTAQSQSASVIWLEQFTGPSGPAGGIPPGCPAIDPLPPQPVTFAPFGRYTAASQTLVPPSCTATGLQLTVRFYAPNGTTLAQRTATLTITQPSVPPTQASPR